MREFVIPAQEQSKIAAPERVEPSGTALWDRNGLQRPLPGRARDDAGDDARICAPMQLVLLLLRTQIASGQKRARHT